MLRKWKECKLGDVISSNNQSIGTNYSFDKILYLDTGSITEGKIENFQKYNLSDAPSRAKRLVKNNDIVYSTVRPIQKHYGFIINPPKNLVVSTGFSVIETNIKLAEPLYIYYYLSSDSIVETLDVIAEGATSAYPSLKPSDIENLWVFLPSLPEQKAIASVLSSLDNKIDLLHRQNKTLEAMAETLFRQWFVEEADESWEEISLNKVVDIGIGRTPPRKEFEWFTTNPSDMKWVSIKDMGNSGVFILNTTELLTIKAINKFNIPLIPKDTVLLSFKMTIGRVAIASEEMLSNEAIAHFKFSSKTPFTKEYLYLFLKTFKYDTLGSTSSIVTSINSTMIKELNITIPDKATMVEFQQLTESYFDKILSNQKQIRTLEKLRDTLLPKLMSGEAGVNAMLSG
ncbi:MAG: restriction endonuclease subunit S [Ignavibacteria bacterium]